MLTILFFSCGKRKQPAQDEVPAKLVQVPIFNADSAYANTVKQVEFGPRIPNTTAHKRAGDYFIARLKGFGAQVISQEFDAMTFDGQKLFLRNIVASFNPEKQKRILLAAHWDTRPFSDKDKEKPNATFEGANDGASGVAVLLEVARQLGTGASPDVGIDIILFDGEDWGEREGTTDRKTPPEGYQYWWCLGSQYWVKHNHKPHYTAYYGILLDMVGGKGAHFFQEETSLEYAPKIVAKVWNTASRLGYSSTFVQQKEAGVLDDHVLVNQVAGIPMIDIIPYDPIVKSFGDFHHTQKDNVSLISKETLATVGTVLMNVIYYEE